MHLPQDRPGLSFGPATPDPTLNALFERKDGWIGADGAYSVDLADGRRLWLFSDTWVGQATAGKRSNATIINNSVGVQKGKGEIRFSIGRNADKKPSAIFTPPDGTGWYWLQAGVYVNKKLFVFLSQIEKTGDGGVFGFRPIGQSLGVITNPDDDPTSWRCEYLKLPCTIFGSERQLTFGAAIVNDPDYVYVFGTDENLRPASRERFLIVARVRPTQIHEFSAWRFYDSDGWGTDFRASKRMIKGMASEGSVSYLPDVRQYVLVYTDHGLSDRILARTAAAPTGPWSASIEIYRCPEPGRDKKIFCYAAKAHPSLANGNELVISYVANSFDFWQVAADASIYLPKFIRAKYRESK
jgi:hypothetical protein